MPAIRRAIVTFLCDVTGTLSADTAARAGAALGVLAYHLGFRRRVVFENIFLALGLKGAARRKAARQSYATMGANFIEMWTIGSPNGPERGVLITDPMWTARQYRNWPGSVFLTLHIGSWDMAGYACGTSFKKVIAYAKAQHDTVLDDLINRQRGRAGMEVVLARHAQRTGAVQVMRGLRQGIPVGLLADQKPSPSEGAPAIFLGVPCLCHAGPAFFSRRQGAPIVPVFCLRAAAGRFRWFLGRPCFPGDRTEAEIIQHGMDQLSAVIAAFPGQYFWHHRRFRTRAEGLAPRVIEPWKQRGLRLLVDKD